MKIQGTVAIVTGASSGSGRAIAGALAKAGADVALVARRGELLAEVAASLAPFGRRVLAVSCDVAEPAAVEAAYSAIEAALGPPDILVNAAGCGVWRPFLQVPLAEHRRMMDVNYWGTFHWVRAVLPGMRARRRGSVVNLASGSAKFPLAVTSGYSASKLAVAGLSEALRRELLGSGVRVSTLFPGSVRTPFWDPAAIEERELPWIVRYAPKMSPAAVARQTLLAIRLGLAERTFPLFVGLLARLNALWVRLGDLVLSPWGLPTAAAVLVLRYLLAR
jgi:short-subunit dehydrogenase